MPKVCVDVYGKIFTSMYDGTLRTKWQALVAFQQMIVLSDQDGVVDMTVESIAARTGIPLGVIAEGIEFLEQPEKFSRSPESDGKRIDRLSEHRPWGWRIVNYAKYRDMRTAEDRREYHRQYYHDKNRNGARKKLNTAQPDAQHCSTRSTNAEAEVDIERGEKPTRAKRSSRVPKEFIPDLDHALTLIPGVDAECEAQKFRDWEFKTPRSDWPAAWRSWVQRCKETGQYARKKNGGWV